MNETITMDCGCKFDLDQSGQPIFNNNFKELNEKCQKTWDLLSSGNTEGVFQLETYLGKKYTKKLKPENIDHLAALIAILRPGCLNAHLDDGISVTDHFIMRKNLEEPAIPLHPALKDILYKTYYLCVYQEQQIKIGQEIAGMDGPTSDYYLRKAVGKKVAKLIAEGKSIFLEGCKKTGKIDENTANQVFSWIEAAGRYSFNASHSQEYARITFMTAYAKAHFPHRFYRSVLSHAKDLDEITKIAYNARENNIYVAAPDIRLKNKSFIIRNDLIYFGLESIKDVGSAEITKILDIVNNIDFLRITWSEFLTKYLIKIKKTAVKRMIAVGCFDFFNIPRRIMANEHDVFIKLSNKEQEWAINNCDLSKKIADVLQEMLDFQPENKKEKAISNKNRYTIINGLVSFLNNKTINKNDSIEEISNYEKSFLGIAITAHKVDAFNRNRSIYNCSEFDQIPPGKTTSVIGEITEIKEIITKNGDAMAFLTIEDEFARLENLVVFPQSWEKNEGYIIKGNVINFIGYKKDDGFIVDKCKPAELKLR